MFAKAFIVAATFLVEQRSPAHKVPALVVAPKVPAPVTAPGPAPIADPVHIGPAGMPAAPSVNGPSADELVTKVQSFYQSTNRFTAKFRQDYTNKAGFDTPAKDGKMYVKKPGKMRWDYKGKGIPIVWRSPSCRAAAICARTSRPRSITPASTAARATTCSS